MPVSQAQPEAPRFRWEQRKEFQTASGPQHLLPHTRYLANHYFLGRIQKTPQKNRPVLATSRSCCEKEEKQESTRTAVQGTGRGGLSVCSSCHVTRALAHRPTQTPGGGEDSGRAGAGPTGLRKCRGQLGPRRMAAQKRSKLGCIIRSPET